MSSSFGDVLLDRIFNEEYLTEEYFSKYLKLELSDEDVNPLEDYFIVKLYLHGKSTGCIARFLKRSLKCVNLRLRLLLESNSYLEPEMHSSEVKQYIISKFRERGNRYKSFCEARNWEWCISRQCSIGEF